MPRVAARRISARTLPSESCWSYVTLSAGTSVDSSCASISDRIHSSSSNCREVGYFSFFRNISRVFSAGSGTLPASKNVKTPKQAPPLASSCEGDDGVQVFPPFASGTRSTHWSEAACSLIALRASPSVPMLELPRDEGCSPVPAAVRRALRGATDQSLHGFADGSSSCQGTGSLPALFVCLWLHPSCCSARRPRALLTQDFGDQIADLPRFPEVKSLSQRGVPVDTFRDFSKEQATTEAAEQCPGLVTAPDSFETFCPSRDHAPRECHRRSPAKLGEQLLVSVSQNDVPERAVQKGAVVQRFSWRYWLRVLRELLTGCRTAASCCPGCRLSWKVTPTRSSRRGVSLPQ